ncbi:MAG: hypothetical protein L6V93_08990 [Clostridiales bacterium]|nr:MAG: hypothetical protein L6V93_08990 [Clostridiales bacterium]
MWIIFTARLLRKKLAEEKGNAGILFKRYAKRAICLKTVILDGALPRKTFSMGEACDKRFYLEGRKKSDKF